VIQLNAGEPSGGTPRQHIFVYSDSLSWGIIPLTRARLPFANQ